MSTIAQVVAESQALYIYGPLGIFCAYFILRGEKMGNIVLKEMRSLSHRIDGMTRAMLVDVLSREGIGGHARLEAEKMLAKIAVLDEQDREQDKS